MSLENNDVALQDIVHNFFESKNNEYTTSDGEWSISSGGYNEAYGALGYDYSAEICHCDNPVLDIVYGSDGYEVKCFEHNDVGCEAINAVVKAFNDMNDSNYSITNIDKLYSFINKYSSKTNISLEREFISELVNKGLLDNDASTLDLVLANADGRTCVDIAERGLAHEKLINNDNKCVREAIARSCNGDYDILKHLAKDDDADVRRAVAKYCNKNEDILNLLKDDDSIYVRAAVASQGYNLDAYVNDKSPLVRIAVAKCDDTPPKMLIRLIKDDNWEVRETIAKKGIAIDALINDPDENVRCAAITYIIKTHPSYDLALKDYISDPSDKVRATLARLGYELDTLSKDQSQGVSAVANEVIEHQKSLMAHEPVITECIEGILDTSSTTENFYGMTYNALYTLNIGVCDGYNEYEVEMIGKSYHSGQNAVAYITNPALLARCIENKETVFPLSKEYADKLEGFIEEVAMKADKEKEINIAHSKNSGNHERA